MAGVNKVILLGNVGKDPEVRALENNRKVASFSLATTESYKNQSGERVDKTEWHNVVFWGPIADVIERYVKKGSKLYIEGRIRTRSYEQEGVKKYITEIDGQSMTMLDSAPKSDNYSAPAERSSSSAPLAASAVSLQDDDENDLPF